MTRISRIAVTLSLALAAIPALAQESKPAARPAPAPQAASQARTAPAAAMGVRAEVLKQIQDAEEKLIALAEAVPADKMGWRPGQGVRSMGEVLMHVAGANYFFPRMWGTNAPQGVDPRGFEKLAGDKAQVVSTLKTSFEHVRKAIQAVPEAEVGKSIEVFGNPGTPREAFLYVATHAHEHLGQAIAYARTNGIVPPWSAGGGQ